MITALDRSNSFKKNVDGANGILYGIMEADAGENTKFTLGGLYQRNRDTIDPSGLLMATDNSDLGLPRQTFLGAKWNKAVFSKVSLFGEVEHYFNDDWKYTGKISYTRSKSDEAFGTLARRNNGDPSMTARIGILSKYFGHTRQIAINNNLNGKFSAFGRKHDIFLRHSYNREKSISRNIDSARDTRAAYNIYTFSGNGDIPYPDWGNKAWDGVSQTLFTTNMLTGGIRFNPLENLHILAGGSYTRFKSHYVENAWRSSNPNRPYTENTLTRQNHFTPYFGITFDITPHRSLYASYTSIFKPSYGRKDREGKQIKPKTGNNLEIGWKGAWRNNKLNASVALFQLDEKNRPYAITKTMNPTIERTYYITAGKVRSHGWEAEISGDITDNWKISAGYTFNTSRYRFSESNSAPAGLNFSTHTPKHMFRLYTSYKLPFADRKWTVGGGLTSQSRTLSSGSIAQGGYTLWNADVSYKPNDHLDMALIVNNLTNKRYYQNKIGRNAVSGNYYGEPRNISFKLNWKF